MENSYNNPHYNHKNLIPLMDEHDMFVDFALKTGHPIILDYSRITREIVVKNGFISFGEQKKKGQIETIGGLRKVLAEILQQIYRFQFITEDYIMSKNLMLSPRPSQRHDDRLSQLCIEHKDMWKYIVDQVAFDVLYDKYQIDSPRLTLNDYCTNFIHFDWDNSIYDLLHSENINVTPALYHECLNAAIKEFAKTGDAMSETTKGLAKKIRSCEALRIDCKKLNGVLGDCPEICPPKCIREHLEVYFESLKTELAKKKDATYKAMIEEINREIGIMSDSLLKEDIEQLGVDPDLFFKYLDERNASWHKDVKKPKFVWDYLYFNGCPDLITSKQYKRNFKRDSNNSYQRFTDDFDKYDKFVETVLPKDEDIGYEYFKKSMDFYHLEIYKRLDFIYRIALKFDDTSATNIDKEYFLVKRFHPVVIWPDVDIENNCPRYDEKHKYYRPLLFMENYLMKNNKLAHDAHSEMLIEYNLVRAKIYELFNFNYEFVSKDYNDISDFIRNNYNMQNYHTKNKEWYYMDYRKKRFKKARIQNVLLINNALFGRRKSVDDSIIE